MLSDSQSDLDQSNNTTAAPLWRRFMAMLYDSFLLLAISMAYSAIVTSFLAVVLKIESNHYQPMSHGPSFLFGWILTVFIFYYYFWTRGGQTLGMRAWRIKLKSLDQKQLTLSQCTRRFIGAFFSLAACGLGFWWMLINADKASWHDRLSGTQLVLQAKQK